MVRRGSTVRVRQRALQKRRKSQLSCCLCKEHADKFRTHFWYARRTATASDAFWHSLSGEARPRRLLKFPAKGPNTVVQAGEKPTPSLRRRGRRRPSGTSRGRHSGQHVQPPFPRGSGFGPCLPCAWGTLRTSDANQARGEAANRIRRGSRCAARTRAGRKG